jgi:ankyrin repeat protein
LTGSPLLLACVRGYADVIQYLLDAGADADACGYHLIAPEDKAACTPLDILKAFGHAEASELLLSAAAGSARKGVRTTPVKTRAQRAGIQLEETPPAVRRDIAEGGPVTQAKAKAEMRAIQEARVQRVTRAEQTGTVSAALLRANDAQRKATQRAREPSKASGSRCVYTCKKCGEPKKGHVCKMK